ncbi:kynurenine/alpha-aminoadipate aminotransferase, mitochondrial-like isoform X2 [Anthonomus grandis grandis]|uniref:kynurenine/alpha-aminoadipate aminotransferase, mitochondrial-like isoform X2 n=1 Tax=Anthonomus grandis grandis TaxID=2921223 RepID=UPI002165DEA3|nr:kynurenine/alpha-aminoadipate aminotransferase, mitochondrial-like isoform X2 [Anthonomus grandis grandis]XP_050308310.1 kynurenine/alpha-aminoadipate aminotransferase, mitochondrial-like isoform X2 [Anthonomus grandis grandis]
MSKIDYSQFISVRAGRRRPALTRELTKRQYGAPKESISLAEGMPNEVTFPFQAINILMKDGSSMTLQGSQLHSALQYIPTQGYPPLLKKIKEFTQQIHSPPNWQDREVIMTNGSQEGISKTLEMVVEEGDPVLVQNPLYAGTEIILKPFKPNLIGIEQDELGIIPSKLIKALESCKAYTEEGGGRMPKVIYLNPTGSNPTGVTMSLERRREVYDICCKYNILILEDDAYYFLHFLEEQPVSFLSLDVEGRVIRFDSMSKVLSSGLRLAWLTGPKQLVHNVELHIQSAILHSSTLSQVMLDNLIELWGFNGLLSHFNYVRRYYQARRDFTVASMDKHLKGICEWSVPTGGMFVWIKVRGVADVYDMLMTRGLKKNITFVPGHAFMADPTEACQYIRASFSKASLKQIDKAMQLLGELIREEHLLLRRKLDGLENNILR